MAVVRSNLTGKLYNLNQTIRILKWKQVAFYIHKGIYPEDIMATLDRKTGEEIIVFLFDREKTAKVYREWCKLLDEANLYEQK